MKYGFLDLAKDVLQKATTPLIYQEIWQFAEKEGLTKKIVTKGKTPWQTLGARLFVDVRDNINSHFIKVGKNPARFFLKAKQDLIIGQEISFLERPELILPDSKEGKIKFSERDIHPLITYFAFTNREFNKGREVYTKTIFHEKSKKNGLNEWVHPDIVGFHMPIENWNRVLLEYNDISDSNSIRLFSIEVKKRIDKSNYREYFFQAVSNSSWANESYLLAADIQQDDDLLSELERLSTSFGIGIGMIDVEDIDSSKILFPARSKNELDWELMNKLCEQNRDFESFLDNVTKDFKVKTIHPEQYDKILKDPEEYIQKFQKK
jgi:uncharacterized protein